MPVFISMLRGVNVGGHNAIKMDALRALYASLKLRDAQTYVQSGNVIFRTDEIDATLIGTKIQNAIARKCDIQCEVILRTVDEMRKTIAKNPFAGRSGIEPGKLLITFLAAVPAPEACEKLLALKPNPEELHLIGRELYIYFPDGAGKSKLPWASLEKKLRFPPGTARNWNSVTKMLELAEQLEGIDSKTKGGPQVSLPQHRAQKS